MPKTIDIFLVLAGVSLTLPYWVGLFMGITWMGIPMIVGAGFVLALVGVIVIAFRDDPEEEEGRKENKKYGQN